MKCVEVMENCILDDTQENPNDTQVEKGPDVKLRHLSEKLTPHAVLVTHENDSLAYLFDTETFKNVSS